MENSFFPSSLKCHRREEEREEREREALALDKCQLEVLFLFNFASWRWGSFGWSGFQALLAHLVCRKKFGCALADRQTGQDRTRQRREVKQISHNPWKECRSP